MLIIREIRYHSERRLLTNYFAKALLLFKRGTETYNTYWPPLEQSGSTYTFYFSMSSINGNNVE